MSSYQITNQCRRHDNLRVRFNYATGGRIVNSKRKWEHFRTDRTASDRSQLLAV